MVVHAQTATPVDQLKDPSDVVMLNPQQLQELVSRLKNLSPEDIQQFWNLTTELSNALAKSSDNIPKLLGQLQDFVHRKVETSATNNPLLTYLGKIKLFISQTGDAYKNENNPNNKFFHGRFFKEVSKIADIARPFAERNKDINKELESNKQWKQLLNKSFMPFNKEQLHEIIGARLKELTPSERLEFWTRARELYNSLELSSSLVPDAVNEFRDVVKRLIETGSKPNYALGIYLDKINLLITQTGGDAYKNVQNPYHSIFQQRIANEVREIMDMARVYQ